MGQSKLREVAVILSFWVFWFAGAPSLARAADNTGVITGAVSSSKGAEAGVWVIAETDDTPTKLRKIVVTDDQGRVLLPE